MDLEHNFDQEKRRIRFIKSIPLWLVVILVLLGFLGGLLLGGNIYLQKGKSVIRGIDLEDPAYGSIENKDFKDIPDYLTKDVDFNLFWDVWNIVKDKYYDKTIPETKLFYGALSGIVNSLEDSYSIFLTAQDTDEFEEELQGNFEGIGAEIGIRSGILTVITPLPDSPAIEAGLRAKDAILEIDGENTENINLYDAVNKIRGEKGTEVTLTVYREGFIEPKQISITRQAINVKSVVWEIRDDGIVYIKVRQFNGSTIPLFNDAVMELSQKIEINKIILDLRNNPGGYLQSAIDMAGEWINGQVVVSEKRRQGDKIIEINHKSQKSARLSNYNTVVLINGGTASGSEIVAGALQDLNEAVIIGEQSFGKGSVQDLTQLKDGSSIKLTIAKWFTPNGRSIEDEGITPDVVVEMNEEDYDQFNDPQLKKAVEILNN